MNIAFVLPIYWPVVGGCEIHTHEIVKRLTRQHHVQVITLVSRQEDKQVAGDFWFACMLSAPHQARYYEDHGARVTNLGVASWQKKLFFPFLRLQGERTPSLIRRFAMAVVVRFYRHKLSAALEQCDVIHAVHGDVGWLAKAALMVARQRGVPFVFTPVAHLFKSGDDQRVEDVKTGQRFPLKLQARGALSQPWLDTCRRADILVAMTRFEQTFYIQHHINNRVWTIAVAPVVSDHVQGTFRKDYEIDDNPMVLFLGRNNPDKGVRELLQAACLVWEHAPKVHFVFAGPLEWGMERTFEAFTDPRTLVLGTVSLQAKSEALAACDLLCVPSQVESLGGIYLEAWVFRKPIIAANIPPIRDLTKSGRGGVLVDPKPEHIAEAILRILDNPSLGSSLGSWGRTRVEDYYNWDRVIADLQERYGSLVGLE